MLNPDLDLKLSFDDIGSRTYERPSEGFEDWGRLIFDTYALADGNVERRLIYDDAQNDDYWVIARFDVNTDLKMDYIVLDNIVT